MGPNPSKDGNEETYTKDREREEEDRTVIMHSTKWTTTGYLTNSMEVKKKRKKRSLTY